MDRKRLFSVLLRIAVLLFFLSLDALSVSASCDTAVLNVGLDEFGRLNTDHLFVHCDSAPATIAVNVFNNFINDPPVAFVLDYQFGPADILFGGVPVHAPNGLEALSAGSVMLPPIVFSAEGVYGLLALRIPPFNGIPILITVGSGCTVADLTKITDPDAVLFEAFAPRAPQFSLQSPFVDPGLDALMTQLQNAMLTRFGVRPERQSGYRPLSYQMHFYELRTKLIELRAAYKRDPGQMSACSTLQSKIDFEIDHTHHIVRVPPVTGLPQVNPPYQSTHTANPAGAIDLDLSPLSIPALIQIDQLADLNGLHRPCVSSKKADTPHFTKTGTPCDQQTVQGIAQSPVDILLQDPSGKRVGFDPTTGGVVNGLGSQAFYSGPDTEPQLVEIGGAVPGPYTLTAFGSGSGPYTLTLQRLGESSEIVSGTVSSGVVSPGQKVSLNVNVPLTLDIAVEPKEHDERGDDEDEVGQAKLPTINPRSDEDVSVGILSSPEFDATTRVDKGSLTFGRTGDERSLARCKRENRDINGDGLLDLVCEFRANRTGFLPSDSMAILKGRTVDGIPIEGNEFVRIRPKED